MADVATTADADTLADAAMQAVGMQVGPVMLAGLEATQAVELAERHR
jgi:hypothetical protein